MRKGIKLSLSDVSGINYITILKSAAVGIFAGLCAVVFRAALLGADKLLHTALDFLSARPAFIPLWFILLVAFSLLVSLLLKWEPLISGSGIPQVEGELYGYFEQKWWRVLLAKLLGGILTIGSGLALGREGPSVQLGAMAGKGISKACGRSRGETSLLMTCGAGAGLAAAFNAPLAGIVFTIEELRKKFSMELLLSSMTSCLLAAFISRTAFGQQPVFDFPGIGIISLKDYWIILVFGLLLGPFGKLYQVCTAFAQRLYDKIKLSFVKSAIPFVLTGIIACACPLLLGGGNDIISSLEKHTLSVLLILLAARFIFSITCFASGVPGGIFLPLLTLGAAAGAAFGVAVCLLGADIPLDNFIVLGMTGYFAAVVRSPVTGLLLICEMTGSPSNLLPGMLVSLAAYFSSGLLKAEPIYDDLLGRILARRSASGAGARNA